MRQTARLEKFSHLLLTVNFMDEILFL